MSGVSVALHDVGIGVDPSIPQERPDAALRFDLCRIDFCDEYGLFIGRCRFDDVTGRIRNEAASPELDAFAARRIFVADSIRCRDVAAVGDRMTTLDRFP
jgi:hypothetical protein